MLRSYVNFIVSLNTSLSKFMTKISRILYERTIHCLTNNVRKLTQFSFHFLAAPHFVDKLPLKGVDARIQLQVETVACEFYLFTTQ